MRQLQTALGVLSALFGIPWHVTLLQPHTPIVRRHAIRFQKLFLGSRRELVRFRTLCSEGQRNPRAQAHTGTAFQNMAPNEASAKDGFALLKRDTGTLHFWPPKDRRLRQEAKNECSAIRLPGI
jgi:hypothetical protein